jgi:DHA1 family bicyclomycin/chloramphenicol resistance-like MFS transporter
MFLVILLTVLSALGQFATSVYTPSFPAIGAEFGVPPAAVQLTLTVALGSFAVGQLAYGPLTDRFGRRSVLLPAILVYIAGSLLCVVAPSLDVLIAGRILQAVGACAGVVVSRAVVRDLYDGAEMVRVFAVLALAFSVVPAAAPFIGGYVQEWFGWRASFVVTVAFGVFVLISALWRLPETIQTRLPRLQTVHFFHAYWGVLTTPSFIRYCATTSLIMAALFGFLAGAPQAIIGELGIAPSTYGLFPSLTVCGFVIGSTLARRQAGRWSDSAMVRMGTLVALAGSVLLLAFALMGLRNVWAVIGPMLVFVTGMGLVLPVATSAAMQAFRHKAGTAAALMGFLQMGGGAVGTLAVAAIDLPPLIDFPAAMVGFAVLAMWAASRTKHVMVTA